AGGATARRGNCSDSSADRQVRGLRWKRTGSNSARGGSSSHSSRITPHELRIDLPISSSDFLPPASCKNVCSSIVSESGSRGVIGGDLGQQCREFLRVLRRCHQASVVRNQFTQCRQVGYDHG